MRTYSLPGGSIRSPHPGSPRGNTLIQEYLGECQRLFPEVNLRAKHHYLAHYPDLILEFGPLVRVWTLRFESKHSYFKRCLRQSQNYKNVTHTLFVCGISLTSSQLVIKGRCGRSLQRHLVYYHFLIQIYFKMRLSTNNVVSIM